jgi:hypothetical protein
MSTSDIVADVVETSERTESVPESSTPEPTSTPTEPAPEPSAAAKFLIAQGHKMGKRPDGKTDLAWLPFTTIEKALDRYLDQHRTTWTSERTSLAGERDTLKQQIDALREMAARDPKAFLTDLASVYPQYQTFLQPQPAPQAQSRPDPDIDLGNGHRTYSPDGLAKLLEWQVAQIEAKYEGKRQQETQSAQERERALQKIHERSQAQMTEAQSWPLFGTFAADGSLTPFQEEVLTALKADKSLDLRGAYMKVAMPRLLEDDAKKRERWAAEVNAAPKSTSVPRTDGIPQNTGKPRETRDVVRSVIESLERQRS